MSRLVREFLVACMRGSSELKGSLARSESNNPIFTGEVKEQSTDLLKVAYLEGLRNSNYRHIRIQFEILALSWSACHGTSFFSSVRRDILRG